ncbi:hypothetical protein [uncultured Tenacibaculum sp.]|uniref:hypothetical protein n=1 Tax=uncultured Tenacibaculum sp. TaxID=174713 RepID=UPI00260A50FD|nr:hypothetical protein [uncultured Tenacibaculum sp.]
MKKKILLVLTLFSFLAYSQNSCTLDETKLTGTFTSTSVGGTKIKASDATAQHEFGERVAIDGNIAVASSRSNEAAEGKVYVFVNDGSGNWTQQTILKASDGFAGDNFGSSVAIEGNYLIVGARSQTNASAVDTGAAYLFEYNGIDDTWTEVAVFEPSDGSSGDRFGESVSIEGNLILIGSRDGCVGGCAYLYENDGTNTFTYSETKLEPQVQSNYSGARFGYAVLIKNGRAYVGGARDYSSVGNAHSGGVQIWDQANDGTWSRTHRLRGTETTEFFGCSLSVEDDYLVIGALNYETSSTPEADQGRVFVYKADVNGNYLDSNRVMIQNTDKDSFTDQRFGSTVALENGYLYVGARGNSGEPNSDAVYIFKDDGTNNWTQFSKVTTGDSVGYFSNNALSVSYPNMIVGQHRDHFPSNSGAIHFVPLASTVTPTASITASTDAFIGQNNATITLNFSDEATRTEIQFSVDGGATYPYTFNDDLGTSDITYLGVGTYDLKARFTNGSCELDLGTVTINQATYTAIPDANFEARLEALGYDDISGDGQVPTPLIEVVTELQLAGQGITDLTGIEDFVALEELKANGNNITAVDLSNNTALKLFQMTSSSSLGSIDVSNNPVLEDLQIHSLTSAIDISNLTALDRFACVDCTFTTLNTSGNPNLRHLDLEDTPVTTLDLSTNTNLEILELENTNLVALDLSKNTSFKYLYAQDITTLTTLNIKNGNNTNISAFDIIGTPILCVLVDDLAYSTTNWTNIESTTRFSETNCNYTTIPDAAFEAVLESQGYDDISGDGRVPTSLIETLTVLNISSEGVTDLTGIEDFTALEELKANQNDLTSINLTNNTALKVLWIRQGNNNFSSIDVSKNLALEDFRIQYSGTSLDISNNPALTQFMCTDCSLTTLDTSANTNLTSLDLEGSDITTLDLSTNINLTGLEIDNTNLVELDLSNNTALKYLLAENITTLTSLNIKNGANTNIITFETAGSPVPCILVDDVTYSTSNWTDIDVASSFNQLYCDYTTIPDANFEAELESLGYDDISGDGQVPTSFIENITSLSVANKNISDLTGIEDFTALETLSCQSNSLTSLNVSFNKELIELTANANNITSIDLSKNTKLEKLIIGANELTSIDVSNNTLLQRLDILYNDITDLNISNNPNLTSLNAYNTDIASYDFSNNPLLKNVQLYNNNNLTSLNVSNLTVLDQLQVHNTGITSLDLTNNIDLRILRASSTNITALDLSHQSKLIQLYANNTDIMYLNVRNGNNTNVTQFHADNTPNLSCVIVDDSNYSTTNWTNIDSGMTFSESYCEYTTVADANFEAALNTLGYDDIANDGQVPTTLIKVVTSLDVSNQNIADLTGIQDFTELANLNVETNVLTSLDLSSNVNLQNLNFDNNNITTLNLGSISKLVSIEGRYNQLSTIDLTQNPDLTFINLRDNLFTTVNVASNPLLETINLRACSNLTSIDISNNPNVKSLFFQDTALNGLDVSQNPLLETIVIERVNFNSIDVSNLPALIQLRIADNNFTSLDVSNNPALVRLECENNNLTYLNLKNGNNTNMPNSDFIATGNSSLTCILVDDATWSTTNWTNIDGTASFNDTYCRYTAIPDATFETRLETLGYDDISGDGQVPTALIETVTSLTVNDLGINELTGIEDFTALVTLNARGNNFTTLDMSQNVLLEHLYINNNSLPSIDVSKNILLRNLNIGSNSITSLDLSNNPDLRDLWVQGNGGLTSLDLSNNLELRELYTYSSGVATLDLSIHTELRILSAYRTSLSTIDLSNNPELRSLRVDETNVTVLDLSYNTKLETLRINNTGIASLDLSNNIAFKQLWGHDTSLSSLNVKNGNNSNVTTFRIENNPSLNCVLVDDASYSTTNWTDVDDTTSFSDTYCNYTTVPDANFEATLESLGYDDISGDGQVPTPLIETVEDLTIVAKSIADITGIEDFIALKTLNCASNSFTSLDLSNNPNLTSVITKFTPITTLNVSNSPNLDILVCSFNDLSTLDVSKNTALTYLECNNNNLTSLDVSLNTALLDLRCGSNSLTAIDVTKNTALTSFWCQDNSITDLDLSNQTELVSITVNNNNLSSLNVKNGNNANVTDFIATGNTNLTCINVDDTAYSTTNWLGIDDTANFSSTGCRYTQIPDANFETELEALGYDDISGDGQVPTALIEVVTSLALPNKGIYDLTGIEDFIALTSLNCRLNHLTAIDVTQNTLLKTLTADSNSINSIDLSKNTDLEILNLAGSNLTSLDITNNTSLRKLLVNGNGGLTSLNISQNTKLVEFKGYSTSITSFDFSVHPDLETVECYGTQISTIDFSNNPVLRVLRVDNTNITELDLSNNPNIETLRVNDTGITSLDLSKQIILKNLYAHDANLSYLNVKNGNNTNVTTFRAEDNLNLTCIIVDDATYSKTNWTDIDGTTSFTDGYCRYTTIPDTNFEAALEGLGYDDISNDGQVPTILIEEVTTLNVTNLSITDFTGIEDFVGLTSLDVGNNSATSIDLTNLTLLEYLRLDAMSLTSIDLSKNTALVDLRLSYNAGISTLDLSNNTLLETAHIGNNSFTTIDLSKNSLLYELRMAGNNLTALDLSSNTALKELNLSGNKLTYLNLKSGNNTTIENIHLRGNLLSCVLVDDASYSTTWWFDKDNGTSYSDTNCGDIQLALKVYLQGAFLNPNTGEESLMRDDLRVLGGVYGSTTPYSDGATISDAIKEDDAGSNSMVDWIWVELRDADDTSIVIDQKSGVLQRDGDIVDVTDSNTPLSFDVPSDNYYIVIKHRNHLSIMTSSPISLSSNLTSLDLSSDTNMVLGRTNALVDMGSGIFAILSGDFDKNGQIQNIDTNAIIQLLGVSGYNKADLDMNGQVQNIDINNLLNPNIGKGEQF